jgi:Tfp pilus assembly protein PilF
VWVARSSSQPAAADYRETIAQAAKEATKEAFAESMAVLLVQTSKIETIEASAHDPELVDDAPALRMKRKTGIAWALYHSVGAFAFDPDRFDEVERVLLEAASYDPLNVEVQLLLARVYDERGQDQKAEAHYDTALKIDRQHFGSLAGMATLLLDAKRCDEASRFIERLKKVTPADKLAEVTQREKRMPQCVADAKRAALLQPRP